MREERILLTRGELRRLRILTKVDERALTMGEAAAALGLSVRQVRRLRRGVACDGERGVIHGNHGRTPARAFSQVTRTRIVELYQDAYKGVNATHFSELLAEREDIRISPSSVLRILKGAGALPQALRRRPKRHPPRPRRAREGQLWQVDASPFAWLGPQHKPFALQGAIDDATGCVVAGVFRPQECLEGYLALMSKAIARHGLPETVYTDRHTMFRPTKAHPTLEEELAGDIHPLSQFGRALSSLDITHIKASSPQAKGRIERLWRTFQNRLVVELRLRNVTTLEEANNVLDELIERHNARFAVPPAEATSAYRPAPNPAALRRSLAFSEPRTLSRSGTLSYYGQTYVVSDSDVRIPAQATPVFVIQTLDGELLVAIGEAFVTLKPATPKPPRTKSPKASAAPTVHRPDAPPKDHPWRKSIQRDIELHRVKTLHRDRPRKVEQHA